ncbi:MAG: ABC transporter ATP-binding protein [Ilumatobacteraceae bacterium]
MPNTVDPRVVDAAAGPGPAMPVGGSSGGRVLATGVRTAFDGVEVLHGIDLDVSPGEVVALLGPSGCGKTTLLRSIAGLERIAGGEITLDDRVVATAGHHERPERRRVGMVFQDWALFPHMSVGDNVAYGLGRAADRERRVADALEMVGLAGLHERMPATLSGGQQQRVALARALAPQPSVLLLDEPFSNLDTGLRVQVRSEVHRLLTGLGITAVFVTHDQEEAFVLGDRVAVMHDGHIEQFDAPAAIYEHPVSAWVAAFVGDANFVPGTATGTTADTLIGAVPLSDALTGAVDVLVRPEHLVVTADDHGIGVVGNVEYFGHDHMVQVDLDDGRRLASRAPGNPRVQRGQRVRLSCDGSASPAFAAE